MARNYSYYHANFGGNRTTHIGFSLSFFVCHAEPLNGAGDIVGLLHQEIASALIIRLITHFLVVIH